MRSLSVPRGRRQRMVSGLLALLMISTMAAGAAIGFGPVVARAQAEGLETASLAPDTALIYMSISLDTEGEQWMQADALLQRLGIESIESVMSDPSAGMTPEDLAAIEEFEVFLGGEIGLVITSLEAAQEAGAELSGGVGMPAVAAAQPVGTPEATDADGSEGFAAIAQPDDVAAAWTVVEEQLQADATETGQTVAEEDYQGVTILSVAGDETTDASGTAVAQVDDSIVLAPAVVDVQAIVDVQLGNTGALADVEQFQELSAAFTEPRLAFIYVNGPAVFAESMAGADMTGFGDMGQFGEMFANAVNAYSAATVSAVDAGFRFDTLTMPGEGGELPPMPANFTPTLPEKVPSNTVLLVDGADLGATGGLDVLALLFVQGMLGIDPAATPVPTASPEAYATSLFEQAAMFLGFNIKTDVIDQLVGEYGLALWGIETLDPTQVNALFVSGVNDPATFNSAVSQISLLIQSGAQGQISITTRQIGTDTVNVVDLSATGTPATVEYGVVGGEFVLGVNNGITEYTGGTTDPLSANPTYQEALAALPAEHNSVVFVNISQIVPIFETFMGSMTMTSEDASEKCAEYASQEAAQSAYDEDPGANWELDQDFDGSACEDYFAAASPVAEPVEPDLSKLTAFAVVGYQQDDMIGSSGILVIAE
ncbi:MAG: DUF3352 domain-containing protein [Thermomicrobiales bacterium]